MLANATNWTKRALVVSMVALAMTIGYVACGEEGATDRSVSSTLQDQISGVKEAPDASESTDDGYANYYGPKNAHTMSVLAEYSQIGSIQKEMKRFEKEGYVYAPLYSYLLEGYVDSLGMDASIASFVMYYPVDEQLKAVYIQFCQFTDIPSLVSVTECVTTDPHSEDYSEVATGLWSRVLPPVSQITSVGQGDVLARWSWSDWGKVYSWGIASRVRERRSAVRAESRGGPRCVRRLCRRKMWAFHHWGCGWLRC